MQPYEPFHAQWLMAIVAAFGLAFILAVGTAGCRMEDHPTEPESTPEVSGAELPDYDDDPVEPEVTPRVGLAPDAPAEDD